MNFEKKFDTYDENAHIQKSAPAGPGMRVKEILTVHRWKRMLF